jgi:hypothetical protein
VRSNTPRLSLHAQAGAVRQRIKAIVVRNAPQVMVKVTGGGRGMAAIAAHLRCISKSGRLPFEDDRGEVRQGSEALRDLAEQWRCGGARIPERSERREAFNVMLSMPAGTNPEIVRNAAREFAKAELTNHRYVMVLHTHQANPHVHLAVRAEGRDGRRLNPRKQDLRRWREVFAEKLRGWGIEAEASSQVARGSRRRNERLWHRKADDAGVVRDCQGAGVVGRRDRSRAGPVSRQLRAVAAGRSLQAPGEAAAARAAGAGAHDCPEDTARSRMAALTCHAQPSAAIGSLAP